MRSPTAVPLDPQAEKWLAKAKPSVAKDFARLFLPAALFLLVLIAAYHYFDDRQNRETILAGERTKLALAEQTLNAEMDNAVASLRILAKSEDINRVMDDPEGDARSSLIKNFSDHIEEIGNYDYISLLNQEGRDLVRVKGTTGIAVTGFPDSQLSPRELAFYRETLAAPKHSLHISTPFIDRGNAKLRSWPALLFGTPVYGPSGGSRGALMISYPIATLTMQLDGLFSGARGHVSVLNHDGHWLYDQTQVGSEWGNMFQENRSFAASHPAVWKQMQSAATGRIPAEDGVYLYTTLQPLARQRPNQSGPAKGGQEVSWKIVSFLDHATLSTWKSRAASNSPFYALFLGFLGVALWHRAQSKASQKLVDEATRLAAKVMDSRAAAIFITDTEGRMVAVNPTLLSLTGFDEQELLYQEKDLFFSEPAEDHPENPFWKRVSLDLERHGEWEGEIHCRRRNGETFPAYLLVGLIRDKSRHATHYVAILNDITVRKQAEEALRESQARFRQLIDQASDGIYVMDLEGRFLDVNQQACVNLGYSREELLGMKVDDVELDIPGAQLRAAFRQMRPGEARTGYGTHRRKDGSTYPLEARSGLTVIGGKPHVLALVRDITERKRLENLQARHQRELEHAARLNIIGEMASGLAHELSQPLSATQNYLRGCIRRLQAQKLDQETLLDVLRLASTQTERAAGIISHIKEFARKREPVPCLLDIRQVTREVLILLEQELKKNRVAVVTSFPEDAVLKVVADKVELEQVMVNLIKNAIEAMQTSETKRIAILAEIPADGMLQVDVADTGPGIPESRLAEIFQPFFTTKREGMGLGLSISHSIIEAQGGRLWASSNSKGGTTFHFTLPLETNKKRQGSDPT